MRDINAFIDQVRTSDRYIEQIYMQGGCYQFHLLLKTICPDAVGCINPDKDHVVSKIDNEYYDITGRVGCNNYVEMTRQDVRLASTWSFSGTRLLVDGNCPHCLDPNLIG